MRRQAIMREQAAQQLFADVTGSADHGDPALIAAEDNGLYSFFHNAQCACLLSSIATNFGGRRAVGTPSLGHDGACPSNKFRHSWSAAPARLDFPPRIDWHRFGAPMDALYLVGVAVL